LQKQMIYVKEGDFEDADMWEAMLTTEPVDPATVVKSPKLIKAQELAVAYVAANGGYEVSIDEVGGHIKNQLDIDSWMKTLKLIQQMLAAGVLQVLHPLPADDPTQRKPDITLARKHLDWEPKISLQEGLLPTIEWFRSLDLRKYRAPTPNY